MNSHSRNLRIFLDIGGYHGHSSLAALDPIFAFDRVFCFEPVPELAKKIREISDPRLVVVEAALSDINGKAVLHHAGTLAGSLFSEAETYGEEGQELAAGRKDDVRTGSRWIVF